MAKHRKRRNHKAPQTKSKPEQRDWTGILINSLIDLLIGALLIIIDKMID
jgi:hypothetical protein